MHTEICPPNLSRRTLVKLMAAATPNLLGATLAPGAETRPVETGPEANPIQLREYPDRPRLFYRSDSLPQIRRSLAEDAAMHAALLHQADALLSASFYPESVAEIGGGQQANYITPATQIADMGLTLGLLYHLTGEERYAARLRDALLYYGGYARWAGPQLIERSPPWHSELDTTTFSLGYASGYDALRGYLTESDRQAISAAMVRLSIEPTLNDWILPGRRIHSFNSMGHNWWGVCVAGGGLSALALLGDDPRAQSWIDAVDAGYAEWFTYPGDGLLNRMRTFERSGPSYEGVGYTNYGLSEYLHYRLAWQNTLPHRTPPRIEQLEHVAEFFLQTLYPTSSGFLTVNFDDSALASRSSITVPLLIACGLGTPEAGRYLQLAPSEPGGALATLLHQGAQPAAVKDPPLSCAYPEMGWAILRSSWEPDATMLAMKSGYTFNHAHADAGTFLLFKQGRPLIIDSGTCAYSRPEYGSYYRSSRAHNVILFEGQGQPREDLGLGSKFPGAMHSLIDQHGLQYVYADATGPMARWFTRNYRHWIWSGDLVLIVDEVRSHSAGQMDWLLHYAGESAPVGSGGVRLSNGPAEALVRVLHPAVYMTTETGLAEHRPDEKIPYLAFHTREAGQFQQFLCAICLDPASPPNFTVEDDPALLHLRVTARDATEDLYLNRRAIREAWTNCMKAGDLVTDAYMLHVRRPAAGTGPVRYLVVDGSYLRRGTESLMESLAKETRCWQG